MRGLHAVSDRTPIEQPIRATCDGDRLCRQRPSGPRHTRRVRNIGSHYRIPDAPLGRGASGTVYRGTDASDQVFAIKVLKPELAGDPAVVGRFARERRILFGVRDPHVVAVHDLVVEGDTLAIVMDFVDGPNLREWIITHQEVTAADIARIVADIARGLAALHAADVVHRDLKPANIIMDDSSGQWVPRITDFGISTLRNDSPERTAALGTPGYISPEALRLAPVTPAADVYALGMVMYELAAGVRPFSGSTQQVAKAQLELLPGRLEDLPAGLWSIIGATTDKDPVQRPRADRVVATLERLLPTLDDDQPLPRLAAPPVPRVAPPDTAETTQAIVGPAGDTAVLTTDAPSHPYVSLGRTRGTWRLSDAVENVPAVAPAEVASAAPKASAGRGWAVAVMAGGVAVAAAVAALWMQKDTPTVSERPAPAPTVTKTARPKATVTVTADAGVQDTAEQPRTVTAPAGYRSCSQGVYANDKTSCPYAMAVADEWRTYGGPVLYNVYSPVTGKYYDMECTGTGPAVCNGGVGGSVWIRK